MSPETPLDQSELLARREALHRQRRDAVARVERLASTQRELTEDLGQQLQSMQEQAGVLDELEAQENADGLLAALVRSLGRRRRLLQRRSASEALLQSYEAANRVLVRASAFVDELQLCALDLQSELEGLYRELSRAEDARRADARLLVQHEARLAQLESDASLGAEQREQEADRLGFELRRLGARIQRYEAYVRLLREEIPAARSLRDTVQQLHDEMASYVQAATSTLDRAGRRIQGLGMAADAPLVVAELHEALAALARTAQDTERYAEQARDLLVHVLPELTRELEERAGRDSLLLVQDQEELSREQARALADRALREAAEAEVDAALQRGARA